MTSRTITINSVDLDVEYSASRYIPATWDDPAEGGEVEIESVSLEGSDVTELLADWVNDRIIESIQSSLADDQREAEEDAAERRADERRECEFFREAA